MTTLIFIFLLLLPFSSTCPIKIWPKPTKISCPNPSSSPLSPSFSISSPLPSHPHLSLAISRLSRLLVSELHRPLLPLSLPFSPLPLPSLSISISRPSVSLSDPFSDQSYNLSVPPLGPALLSASTPSAAILALQTFAQLTFFSQSHSQTLIVTGIYIEDRPLFAHRGLLLDTSRNFFPVEDILRTVRAMGYNKMNVLHWHITDSQSFPIVLPSVPDLGIMGSYGVGMRYSVEDVKRVVDYAFSFAVRVVPEIDVPGHSGSWASAYPEIVTCANQFWQPPNKPALAAEPATGQLNPLNPKTYPIVLDVFRDVANLFPDPLFHAGADELNSACWESDPSIASFLAHGGTLDEILHTFINKTHPFLTSDLRRTAVYWEDIILSPTIKIPPSALPPETTILQTWNNAPNNTKILASMGYRVIVSSWDFYYLDCGHGGWAGNDSQYDHLKTNVDGGDWCAPFKTWQRVYDYNITEGLTEEERKMVIGGEVAMWSEQVDGTVVDGRIWPRAAAMAEALWSGNRGEDGKKRYAEATDRLNEWRHRMVGRGIMAEPIQPLWCARNPGMCNNVQ